MHSSIQVEHPEWSLAFDHDPVRAADQRRRLVAELAQPDTIGFGVLFWWIGFPAWILWTVVMFILSLLPVLGAGLVWLPTVVYLAVTNQWLPSAALTAWGVFTFVAVDNALYAHLAGERMKMHEVPALVAFLGGLAVFGMSGIILGPVILSVTIGLVDVWKRRIAATSEPRLCPSNERRSPLWRTIRRSGRLAPRSSNQS